MAAALAVATFAAYANTLQAPLVYDDIQAIAENESIRHLWPLSRVLLPLDQQGLTVSGRPLLNLSLALNYAISGTAGWSYHVFNIFIHAGAVLLLFGIVRRTLELARDRWDRRPHSDPSYLAFAIAALWSLHPLQTQAVTYTVQRAESLMGFFYLFTLYAFIRATSESAGSGDPAPQLRQSRRWTIACVLSCALGMATKEVMATAPLLVFLYDRTFLAGSFRGAWRERRALHLGLAATWLVLAALIASTGGNRGGTVGLATGVPLWAYPLTQFKAAATYLALSVWPQPLVFEYGTFWVREAGDLLPYALVVLPLLLATVVALVRAPLPGFLGAWFFLILAPTSLAPGTIQMIVEHRMYLPLAAVVTVVVLAAQALGGRRALVGVGVLAVIAGALTYRRNGDYRSHLALWGDTVAKRPLNPRAREGLAEAYAELGQFDAAVRELAEAARLQPTEWKTQFNLARALGDAGRWEEAVQSYERTLLLARNEPRTHNNLAAALVRLGRIEAALPHYEEAERLGPTEPEFCYNHGLALAKLGRQPEAAQKFEDALRRKPASPTLALALGDAFAGARRPNLAAESYAAAVRADPKNAIAHFRLADALLDLERVPEAIAQYEAALALQPAQAEAHHNLGAAYARLERWAEARREFETALRLKPDYPDARRHLEQLREVLGERR